MMNIVNIPHIFSCDKYFRKESGGLRLFGHVVHRLEWRMSIECSSSFPYHSYICETAKKETIRQLNSRVSANLTFGITSPCPVALFFSFALLSHYHHCFSPLFIIQLFVRSFFISIPAPSKRARHSIFAATKMTSLEAVKTAWRTADAVTFDVDSTVIQEEGIDELAKFCGKGDQVADLTKQAMQGNMTFQQSLAVRLNIIKPSLGQVTEFIKNHPPKLTPGIKELVGELHSKNKKVFLVSGGFRCLIGPVAKQLDIPADHVCANRLKFFYNGDFAGFDETEPTSRSGGKPEALRILKEKYDLKTVVHIGDGATDMEACPPADAFIGYGGNVVRESVKANSLWFVTDFNELRNAL